MKIDCPICKDGNLTQRNEVLLFDCDDCGETVTTRINVAETKGKIEELQSVIARLTQRVRELEDANRWVSVEKRLPHEYVHCLLNYENYSINVGYWYQDIIHQQWMVWHRELKKFVCGLCPKSWKHLPNSPLPQEGE